MNHPTSRGESSVPFSSRNLRCHGDQECGIQNEKIHIRLKVWESLEGAERVEIIFPFFNGFHDFKFVTWNLIELEWAVKASYGYITLQVTVYPSLSCCLMEDFDKKAAWSCQITFSKTFTLRRLKKFLLRLTLRTEQFSPWHRPHPWMIIDSRADMWSIWTAAQFGSSERFYDNPARVVVVFGPRKMCKQHENSSHLSFHEERKPLQFSEKLLSFSLSFAHGTKMSEKIIWLRTAVKKAHEGKTMKNIFSASIVNIQFQWLLKSRTDVHDGIARLPSSHHNQENLLTRRRDKRGKQIFIVEN